MKTLNQLFIPVFISIFTISCTKNFLDVNTNPNAAADVSPQILLPNTTVAMAFANSNELGRAAAILMQYNSGVLGAADAYDQWDIAGFENQWNNELYANAVNNLNLLIAKAQEKSPAYSGVAKLQLAYTISMITDLWGDVPYSQAGKGLENGALRYPQPRFDAQQDIYLGNSGAGIQSLFNLVREGLSDIAMPSAQRPSTDDLVYGGDLTRWTRFGNSLLLKFALQVSNKVPDTTKNVINTILTGNKPFIDNIDGSLDFNVPFSTANPNAYYSQDFGGSLPNYQMMSSRFLTLMRNQNDTVRLLKYYTKPAGTFVGYENGSPFTPPVQATRSMYNTYVVGASRRGEAPIRLITAFRNQFILAEAALRFGTPGDPNTYYQNGIRASMKSTGMTDAEINTYFTTNPTIVTLSGTNTQKLQQIIMQKYIASVGNAIESYNDYRRVGYPVLPPPVITTGDDPNTFPHRFAYTNNEGAANPNQPNPRPKTNVKIWWEQ